jgi:hypothetical protein
MYSAERKLFDWCGLLIVLWCCYAIFEIFGYYIPFIDNLLIPLQRRWQPLLDFRSFSCRQLW